MKYSSQGKQLTLDIFSSPLKKSLDPENRWYKLSHAMPWDKIEVLYNKTLDNQHNGAGNKPARMIVGALIVKHQMCLSDEETIEMIRENPYMQYFVGLTDFTTAPIFDSSLFVHIRKRLGVENINAITLLLMQAQTAEALGQKNAGSDEVSDDENGKNDVASAGSDIPGSGTFTDENGELHSGHLIVDATCCDAEVRYPTDLDVLHDAVKVSARVIERLCPITRSAAPKTFLKAARKKYLAVVRKKRKSKSLIRKAIKQQLVYLDRNIVSLVKIVSSNRSSCINHLKRRDRNFIGTCIKVYDQQKAMFDTKTHQCKDRIISVFQPHVRPIVRGKSKAKVEFGSKIGVSVVNGYTFIDHFSWDAYNESEDLKIHLARYKERFGCLPVKCYADKIYMNRGNRSILREQYVQAAGKPLGRPTKEMQTAEYKQQAIRDNGVRNGVEATFGTAKRVYRANNIRAKLPDTGDTWTAMCYLVKNIKKFLKGILLALFGYDMTELKELPIRNIFCSKQVRALQKRVLKLASF